MDPTNVHVHEITSEADKLVCTTNPQLVDLSNLGLYLNLDSLRHALRERGRVFFLEWDGSKVPHDVEIVPGYKIIWTQNGVVTAEKYDQSVVGPANAIESKVKIGGNMSQLLMAKNQQNIGIYKRLEEFSGPNRNHHKMMVYLYPSVS
jgi:hypothetical protein